MPQIAQSAQAATSGMPSASAPVPLMRANAPKAGTKAAVSMPMLPSSTASSSQPASGETSFIMRAMTAKALRCVPTVGAAPCAAAATVSLGAAFATGSSSSGALFSAGPSTAKAASDSWLSHMRA